MAESLPGSTQRSPYPTRRRNELLSQVEQMHKSLMLSGSSASAKSSTLPLPHRISVEQRQQPSQYAPKDRERDGYYSDRNELIR